MRRSAIAPALLACGVALVACRPVAQDSGAPCAVGDGDEVELLPWVRVRASGTRPAEGHDWARETEAGPATVRDDVPDNGWEPPDDGRAVLELDLQPWLGEAVSLAWLEASWQGQEPELSVALLPGCGLEPSQVLDWDEPGEALGLAGRCAGCVELRVLGGEDTVLTALSLTSREPGLATPTLPTAVSALVDGFHPESGLIEGFYGQPWSWREREAALVTLARAGMGLYLYAPKDDPYHRDQWREPYPVETVASFATLFGRAQQLGVRAVFGLSPFVDYDAEDEDDYTILRDKLLGAAQLDAAGVALLADDIEFEVDVTVDAALGAQHAAIANRLLADLRAEHPDAGLWFVPTVYSDERLASWEGAPDYLRALQALDPSIPVMWTGTGTFAETLVAADMDTVRELIGRDPLIWDNYWANDAWDLLSGRVHLSGYQGRSSDLHDAVLGVGANPQIQGSLSRLNAGALAAWIANPSDDTELEGSTIGASLETGFSEGHRGDLTGDGQLLLRVMRAFDGSGLEMPGNTEMVSHIDTLTDDPEVSARALLPILAGLAVVESELHHSGLDSELVDELYHPAMRLHHEGLAGLWALQALAERRAGRAGEGALAQARAQLGLAAESRFVFSIGAVEDLVEAVEAVPAQDAWLDPPLVVPEPVHGCELGQPWIWRPFPNVEQVEVHGLPGAETVGGVVRWRPPHAGTFTAVITADSAMGGWGWRMVELRCWPS